MRRISMVLMLMLVLAAFAGTASADRDKGHEKHEEYAGKFYGAVESMPQQGLEGTWTVNGREVVVNAQTKIEEKHGKAAAGAYVKVEGNYEGNTFIAYEIEVKGDKALHKKVEREKAYNTKLYGVIESMPETGYEGIWVVDGRKIVVNSGTLIKERGGKFAKGAAVEIKGVRTGDTITAIEIEADGKRK